jgi:multimeric flavodoxin WrbA
MSNQILVFYGSYRSDRMGIRLARFVVERLQRRGATVELIDAKAVNLPMLDRMYKEYPPGEAPDQLQGLASKIRAADGFVFVTGEYNWGIQPGLKNLTDHFLEEWFWRPRCDRELFGRTFFRRTGRNRLARHSLRDGDGGGFKHDCRWSHWTDPHGWWWADG